MWRWLSTSRCLRRCTRRWRSASSPVAPPILTRLFEHSHKTPCNRRTWMWKQRSASRQPQRNERPVARLTRFEGRGHKKSSKGFPLCLCFLKKFQRVPPLLMFFEKISKTNYQKGGGVVPFSPLPLDLTGGGAMAPWPPPLNAPLWKTPRFFPFSGFFFTLSRQDISLFFVFCIVFRIIQQPLCHTNEIHFFPFVKWHGKKDETLTRHIRARRFHI